MKLPQFLEDAIKNNTTSLGTHPALPPDEEDSFIAYLIANQYSECMKGIDTNNPKELASILDELVTKCKKIEEGSKEALEKLCGDVVATIFDIPDDTITINGSIVSECDMSKYRMVPDSNTNFTFDDIEDMNSMSDEVYKRRMIDVLIAGASVSLSTNIHLYLEQLYTINPELPALYNEINKYNNALLYNQRDTVKTIEKSNSGKVDVNIGMENERIVIEAEGIIFPVLLEYTIRGIMEVAALQGLPGDMKRAEYIMGKADYRLAENWDVRLGYPLWQILVSELKENDIEINDVGANFMLMEISKLGINKFNNYLQNAFKRTKKGIEMTCEIGEVILYNREMDNFDNFVKVQNEKYPINDNENYTSEELLSEALITDY